MQATNSTTSSSKKRKAQNGVVNSQKSLNHDYLCPVCFEILDEAHVTKCGHTFCLKCIVESLAETNRCPQCNYIVDSYFPNFLVNEVITKYKKDKMIEKKFITNVNAKQKINELHRFFLDKYDELSLPEINQMVEILNSKKNRLEKDLKMQQNVLLKEFLDNAYMHKMQQFEQLQRELEHIKEDQQELLKIIDIDEDIKASESLENKSKETEKDNNIDNTDNDNHVREESSSFIVSQIAGTSWSGGYDDQQSNSGFPTLVNYDSPNSSKFIHSFNSIGFGECEHTEPQIKDLEHREESYLNVRRKKMNFHFKDLEKNYFDRCQKDTFTSIDSNTRLTDLKEILTKFTHFSNLRPLATLTYAKEYVIHNIVSSIEFDKDAEFFGIAGVSKKIKIFDYAAVVKDSLGINYPVNEIECTSKISCLNWNPYYKSMMATSDYEGSVIIWDAFLGKRITSFQEHEKRCWSVDFNKIDINLIASGSDDSKVKIWSANMDSSILTLDGPANICCVRFNPKSLYNIAFGSADHRVYYYDLRNTREPLMKYKEHRKAVSYVKFLNSTELVSASTDSQIKLWNTNDPSCLRTFKGHMNEKNFVGLTANENYIACGSENNSLYVYYKGIDRQMLAYCFERKTQTEESSDFVSAVCWRPGSNVLVAANSQGNIKLVWYLFSIILFQYSCFTTPSPQQTKLMQRNHISALSSRFENCFDSRDSLDELSAQTYHHRMAVISEIEEHEHKIVNDFCHLLEKSKHLFNGLRDLPQHGHKQWQPYFGRTFDAFTKLWKFQQQYRQILDSKYGLKRWQIGEIASKIGQLYYHYYLRTSETNYLNEAFSFYSAIRARGYYSKASKEERAELMVKKLRYYARFIVVCLLLKKMKVVRDLVRELAKQIDDYTMTYDPEDQLEWSLVLSEIKSFIEADNIVSVVDMNNIPLTMSHRLNASNVPPMEKVMPSHLALQEILIVGNCTDQVKFSELTLDMFRMLQALEREPQEDATQIYDSSPAPGMIPNENGFDHRSFRRENPHKYLLYKPTFSQFLVFLSSGFKELPINGVMLIFLSSDGCFINSKQPEDIGYDFGGVITNTKFRDPNESRQRSAAAPKDIHCLYPGDLYPFVRRPLFIIVDSDNSTAFQHIPRYFGQPLVVLMSPEECPAPFHDQQSKGSLFTLFLHCPLTAICLVSNIIELSIQLWEKAQQIIERFMAEAGRLLIRSRTTDTAFIQFYCDDFLRQQMLRFIFCSVVLRMHRLFRMRRSYLPKSHPPISDNDILDSPSLRRLVIEASVLLDIRSLFNENEEE